MSIPVNIEQARDCIIRAIKVKLVPMLAGSPGIGKSQLIYEIARSFNLLVIDLRLAQCDPTDLLGFPFIDEKRQKASYLPMSTFPIEGDELPINPETGEPYDGWVLFLDEVNHADRSVQKSAYKLVLDRMIGDKNLHPRVAVICAGNLDTDGAFTEETSTAMQSRMVHLELKVDNDKWLAWAVDNEIDHRITSYVKFKPQNLYAFDPEHTDKTYASPRTWEFCSRLIKNEAVLDRGLLPLLAGTISEGVAREFFAFTNIYKDLPTITQILGNPETTPVPREPDILFALTGAVAHHVRDNNIETLLKYIGRLPAEFQVLCMRDVLRRDDSLIKHPAAVDWCTTNSDYLF